MTLDDIAKEIKQCQRCPLRATATRPVPGFGNENVTYFLLGEAPGRDEDNSGIPFVGAAGRRLDKLLALAKIDINDCYLSNVCRCRPLGNRTPKKKEIKACLPFLLRELAIVKPKYVITLGSTPLSLFTTSGITQMHGTLLDGELDYELQSNRSIPPSSGLP